VSVSSQRDTENADVPLESLELEHDPDGELHELATIYEERCLAPALLSRSPRLSRSEMRSPRMFETSLASRTIGVLGLFRRPALRRLRSRPARSCHSTPPWSSADLFARSLSSWSRYCPCRTWTDRGTTRRGRPAPATARVNMWDALAMAVTYSIGALVGTAV
jgi:VIT1/CCC1 family predicted Fe2+/Mn2+ transporter